MGQCERAFIMHKLHLNSVGGFLYTFKNAEKRVECSASEHPLSTKLIGFGGRELDASLTWVDGAEMRERSKAYDTFAIDFVLQRGLIEVKWVERTGVVAVEDAASTHCGLLPFQTFPVAINEITNFQKMWKFN